MGGGGGSYKGSLGSKNTAASRRLLSGMLSCTIWHISSGDPPTINMTKIFNKDKDKDMTKIDKDKDILVFLQDTMPLKQ